MAHVFSLSLVVTLILASFYVAKATVPAIFVFGDSTVDVGTNNYLPVHARADIRFNGIDYRGSQATGRFSNGYNIADTIARLFGYKRSPPPFLYLLLKRTPFFKRDVLWGANFASGGSGILDGTGKNFGKVVSMGEQVQQFATVCRNITQIMAHSAESLISKSLIVISIGSNDIFEYFLVNQTRNQQEFITILIDSYKTQLLNLLKNGARKFGIISVSPVGCLPRFRVLNGTGGCIDEMNSYAQLFFLELKALLDNLSMEYEDMKYSLGNIYEVTMEVLENHVVYGFKDVESACCGAGVLGAESACSPNAKVCKNRNEFFFWDRYNPCQSASNLAAYTLYGGGSRLVTPVNFSVLVQDDV